MRSVGTGISSSSAGVSEFFPPKSAHADRLHPSENIKLNGEPHLEKLISFSFPEFLFYVFKWNKKKRSREMLSLIFLVTFVILFLWKCLPPPRAPKVMNIPGFPVFFPRPTRDFSARWKALPPAPLTDFNYKNAVFVGKGFYEDDGRTIFSRWPSW